MAALLACNLVNQKLISKYDTTPIPSHKKIFFNFYNNGTILNIIKIIKNIFIIINSIKAIFNGFIAVNYIIII